MYILRPIFKILNPLIVHYWTLVDPFCILQVSKQFMKLSHDVGRNCIVAFIITRNGCQKTWPTIFPKIVVVRWRGVGWRYSEHASFSKYTYKQAPKAWGSGGMYIIPLDIYSSAVNYSMTTAWCMLAVVHADSVNTLSHENKSQNILEKS